MAFHHHHHHHQTTTTATSCHCFCSPPPPPPPSLPTDPYQIATIISHILQTQTLTQIPNPQNPHHFHPHTHKPTSINPNQTYPTDQFHQPHSGFSSLLQRIHALEQALHHYSSSSSSYHNFSLRDVAARTIQTHFRAYLVRRSWALGQLKELASIKTTLGSLKCSISRRGFVDLDFVSSRAMELLFLLDSIQGEDKMIRDSKRSIANEIAQFLDLLDGLCVKRHQVVTKTMRNTRLVRNDNRTAYDHRREFPECGVGSKCRNVNDDEKKLLGNRKGRDGRGLKCRNMSDDEKKLLEHLKGRVERIGKLSREIDNEEEDAQVEGYYKHVGYDEEDGDEHGGEFSERGVGSKCQNVSDEKKLLGNRKGRDGRGLKCRNMSDDEKKLLEHLKGRVERIGKLTREIDNEEEDAQMEGYYNHVGYDEEDGDDIVGNSSNHHGENRGLVKKHLLHPNGKKSVSFVEDGNVVRVYDIDENTSLDVNEVEDSTKGVQDEYEDEAFNNFHRSM